MEFRTPPAGLRGVAEGRRGCGAKLPRMNARRLLAALACAVPLAAAAQWQWVDGDGRQVFSDRPPPVEVPPSRILRQPGARTAPSAPAAAAPAPAPAPAAAAVAAPPATGGRDKALEEKKREAEAAAAQKRRAEEERIAQARAENCERAKKAKATLDSGVRLSTTNARGELEVMDDEARARETQRVAGVLASDCGPPAPPRQ